MGTQLDKLTIRGFKSIRELENFELKNLNVIIGANGAGKSNFVDFFRVIAAMMKEGGLREYIAGNADIYLYGGAKATQHIFIKMLFGQNGYEFELAPTEDGFFIINNEARHYLPKQTTRNLGSGNINPGLLHDRNSSSLHGAPHGASWYTYNAISSWQIYHFHDTTKEAGMRRYHDQGHNEALFDDASNIAPFLMRLRDEHPQEYKEIVNAVRLVIPFFDEFILKPDANENVRLNWRQKGLNDYPMRPSQLSDGSIRFICLATALLHPPPPRPSSLTNQSLACTPKP